VPRINPAHFVSASLPRLQDGFDRAASPSFYDPMKPLLLALLLCAPLSAAAQAETSVTGFNPRFSTTPSNPDEPNYRPPDAPPNRFDMTIDVDPWRYRDRRHHCGRDGRSCRRRD
jgi:hypothetical protein